ncbi:hypothetical protein E6P78_12620 [Streptomyces sp. A0958]|uniref:hypothetical protein n=1 Tax=Streptomyces sp. A0958 TaxID=2563101 RepID=UPI00109E4780|nr:hypothetical protein [Streptomyces sp. A0958]THA69259.1 hypothetical protein E6P78_12620 [Streptomyces sp. A0958]
MSAADPIVDAGRCWLFLEDPRRAAAALEEGLRLLAPERKRTRATMLTLRSPIKSSTLLWRIPEQRWTPLSGQALHGAST